MTKRKGTPRSRTRRTLSVQKRMKGKLVISRFVHRLDLGDKVVLRAFPRVQKGLYHHRFHGRVGEVVGFSGKHCKVAVKDGNKEKIAIVNPVHLVRVKNGAKTD